jgi:hypothetical protein
MNMKEYIHQSLDFTYFKSILRGRFTKSTGCMFLSLYNFFFFFDNSGGWIQDFTLARQVLYQLSHSTIPFCVSYFWDALCLACLDHPLVAGITGAHHQAQPLVVEMRVLQKRPGSFCPTHFKPQFSLYLPPKYPGLQAWVTTSSLIYELLNWSLDYRELTKGYAQPLLFI